MKKNPLEVPSTLNSKSCSNICAIINPLVADAFTLYVKTKNFHWHLFGSHFRDYHLLFDEQADQIYAMIDVLAERVRKLGGLTIHSIGEIAKLQTIADDNDLLVEPQEMVRRLMKDNQHYTSQLRKAHKVCEKNEDVATASLLEEFLDETERRVWFLYETQANN